jgi:2-amino-4-hydroxy-6-hydroxymethyldihydropteridine diphosphokinase
MTEQQSGQEEPQSVQIYLGLGSNMGDRWENLRRALYLLSQKIHINRVSPVYDTAPVGNTEQPRFLNIVCEAITSLPPLKLLVLVKGIEIEIGRKPDLPDSPRPIDIDILFYGDQIINTPKLVIPHDKLAERAFVLVPLADIAPKLVHPVKKKNIQKLLENLKAGADDVVRWENN